MRLITGIAFLCIAASTLHADSYGPFTNYRRVDPTGRYYVVVRKAPGWDRDPGRGGPVTFAIAERQPGSEPVTEVEDDAEWDTVIPNPEVKVREGDTTLGEGILVRAPARLMVSSSGLGFATIDVFGYNYGDRDRKDAVIIVARDGTIRHRRSLRDLFSPFETARFLPTAGGLFWWGGGWIDEVRQQVVVVSDRPHFGDRLVRMVDWQSGEVQAGSTAEVITALSDVNQGALPFAIELAIESKLTDAKPHLITILEDPGLSRTIRMYAAVALALFGDRRGVDFVREFMLTPTKDDYWEQGFAIHHIRELFGPEAPAVLREVVRHSDRNYAFQDEFKEIGPSAIPTLIEMVRDESDPDGQYLAAECLGNCGPAAKSAVPALIEYAKGGKLEADKRWLVALSIGAIGPDARDAAPVLEQWVHDAQRNLDRIKAVEAETKPKLFESQIIGAEVELDYIVQALKRVRESQK